MGTAGPMRQKSQAGLSFPAMDGAIEGCLGIKAWISRLKRVRIDIRCWEV